MSQNFHTLNVSLNEYLKTPGVGNPVVLDGFLFHQHQVLQIYNGNLFTNKIVFKNCKFTGRFSVIDYSEIDFIDCDIESLFIKSNVNDKGLPFLIKVISSNNDKKNKDKINELTISGHCEIKIENYQIRDLFFDTHQSDLTGVSFANCDIGMLRVNPDSATSLFRRPSYDGRVNVDAISFYECSFKYISGFVYLNFKQQVEFINCIFKDISANTHSYFRHLKSNFIKNNNEFLSNYFAGLELKSKFNSSKFKDNRFEYTLNKLYCLINDFGLDPYRPFLILLGFSTIAAAAITLMTLSLTSSGHIFQDNVLANTMHNFAVLLSGPFRLLTDGFKLDLIEYLDRGVLKLILTAFSSLMWFFLILGIRKRFKIDG